MTITLIQVQIELKATSVGKSFLLLAQINVRLVASVKKYNHHNCIPNIKPGTMMIALHPQERASMIL